MASIISPVRDTIEDSPQSLKYFTSKTKRAIDIIGAIIGLFMGLPVFAVACVIVYIVDGVPPIFRQERIGYGGKSFTIIKLRTLPIIEKRVPCASRIVRKPQYKTTRTGKFWRRHSVDEIIQFWLVLKGDMSLIGHRPIPTYYKHHLSSIPEMSPEKTDYYFKTISGYKPGMSSLSSVNGRGNLSMTQKIDYDIDYAKRASLWFDLILIVRTIIVVISCRGAK